MYPFRKSPAWRERSIVVAQYHPNRPRGLVCFPLYEFFTASLIRESIDQSSFSISLYLWTTQSKDRHHTWRRVWHHLGLSRLLILTLTSPSMGTTPVPV